MNDLPGWHTALLFSQKGLDCREVEPAGMLAPKMQATTIVVKGTPLPDESQWDGLDGKTVIIAPEG